MPTINFECGETTCTPKDKPGKFCKFMVTSLDVRFYCSLFNDTELRDQQGIPSGLGWLQRLPECLKLDKQQS
jgi:hypothetical protein